MEGHGIPREWYNKIPHKNLSYAFAKALGIDPASVSMDTAGGRFTNYMLDLYKNTNACEGMAILAYAIEDTVSRMYTLIWDGMKRTTTDPREYVFFPLHILLDDDHADLLKAGFNKIMRNDPDSCKNSVNVVRQVLRRRSQMFSEVRAEIEATGMAPCQRSARAVRIDDCLDFEDCHSDLTKAVEESYLLKHDLLTCFAEGGFTNMEQAANVLMTNHFVYSRNFVGYLTSVVDKVNDKSITDPIYENIAQ